MPIPMPSPRGTNLAGLFMKDTPTAAYDAAIGEADAAALLNFIRDKLSPEDVAEFCKLANLDPNLGLDENDDDLPKNGIERRAQAQDASRRRNFYSSRSDADFNRRFPGAANIKLT